jgi:hypothetical protein
MSNISCLPDELFGDILCYLPIDEIYFSFQPVCCAWFGCAAREVTEFDYFAFVPISHSNKYDPLVFSVIAHRFPNVTKIICPAKCYASLVPDKYAVNHGLLKCTKLELITSPYGIPFYCNGRDTSISNWKDFYSYFPNYRAISLPGVEQETSTLESLHECYSKAHITQLYMTYEIYNSTALSVLIEYCVGTLTHVINSSFHGTQFLNNITSILRENETTNITCLELLSVERNHSATNPIPNHFKHFLQKSPLLRTFKIKGMVQQEAKLLVQFAPNLTELSIGYAVPEAWKIIISQMPKLKKLEISLIPEFFNGDGTVLNLEEFSTHTTTLGLLKNFSTVRRLKIPLTSNYVNDVIKYCPLLEEIWLVNPIETALIKANYKPLNKEEIKKLMLGCPKLRFIHGTKTTLSFPRKRNGVLDVLEIRESLRPKKRARKT